jgi:hypothetical protein
MEMGLAKNEIMDIEAQGYSVDSSLVTCMNCFKDHGIQEFIRNKSNSQLPRCSFCPPDYQSNKLSLLRPVIEHILRRIRLEWEDPVHEVPYNSREGGYLVKLFEPLDILKGYDLTDHEGLLNQISSSIRDELLCKVNWSSLRPNESLMSAWKKFCDHIKHNSRYFFIYAENEQYEQSQHDEINPVEILEVLANLFFEEQFVETVKQNKEIYRVRLDDERKDHYTKKALGKAPKEKANTPNRMSPAGIPMFYGAFDLNTSIKETYDPDGAASIAHWGLFKPKRDLNVIQLQRKDVASLFSSSYKKRYDQLFLRDFIDDFAKPVCRNATSEHIEYVPTQVVTEYIRHVLTTTKGKPFDGIVYPSSKTNEDVLVLFNDTDLDLVNYGIKDL